MGDPKKIQTKTEKMISSPTILDPKQTIQFENKNNQ